MSVPKKKKSHSKARMERAHQHLTPLVLSKGDSPVNCQHCGSSRRSHTLCPHCGYYGKKQIFTPAALADE
jgi:large subunit ribosomal protein L32